MLRPLTLIIFFISNNCFAIQTPSDMLQMGFNTSVTAANNDENHFNFDLHSVAQIPEVTYHYLDGIFASFYKKLTFNTSIIDSTFKDNTHYELISVPLIQPNEQGLQIELFANFSDLSKQYLSNLSTDHALHDYINNIEQTSFQNNDLSIGTGISFNTSPSSKIKIIISNHKMPGYGDSTALLGFETRF